MTTCKLLTHTACGTFLSPEADYGIGLPIENDQLAKPYLNYIKIIDIAKRQRPKQTDIIDGGSNIGTWSIPISYSHKDLTFHTFEVQRVIFNLQCANVSMNNAWNVYPNWCGLNDICNNIVITQPDYSKRSNFGAFEVNRPFKNSDDDTKRTAHIEKVKMVSIDSLQLKPLFIKLDLEGMEYNAIHGAEWTISAFTPLVWAESHKSNGDIIIPMFESKRYKLYEFDSNWLFVPEYLQNNQEFLSIINKV